MPIGKCVLILLFFHLVFLFREDHGKEANPLPGEEGVHGMPFILNNLQKVKGSCMLKVISWI